MIDLGVVDIYTDGSLQRTKIGIICRYGIHFDTPLLQDISAPYVDDKQTNNRAELFAIYMAIKTVADNYKFEKINIYTDSEYSQKSLTVWLDTWKKNGWKSAQKKPVENQDLIKNIDTYLQKFPICISWVKGHADNRGNQIADLLARSK